MVLKENLGNLWRLVLTIPSLQSFIQLCQNEDAFWISKGAEIINHSDGTQMNALP